MFIIFSYKSYCSSLQMCYNRNTRLRQISIRRISVARITHFTLEFFLFNLHFKRIKLGLIVKPHVLFTQNEFLQKTMKFANRNKKRWKFKTKLIWNKPYEFSVILYFSSSLLNSTTNSEVFSPVSFLSFFSTLFHSKF